MEAFHFLFLERLLKEVDPQKFIVKGGVNLRFFFHSPRYSEDMDLDVSGVAVHVLKEKGFCILTDKAFGRTLESLGIAELRLNDPKKAKQTETTQRFRLRLVTRAGEEWPTKVEFSRRGTQGEIVTDVVNRELARKYERMTFQAQHYSGTTMASHKIGALIGRAVPQTRDAFDLYVLIAGGHIPTDGIWNLFDHGDREKACETVMSFSFQDFQGQVLAYLDDCELHSYDKKTKWETIQEEVIKIISP